MNPRIDQFYESFERSCAHAKRNPTQVQVVAVSKGQSLAAIQSFLATQRPFWALGESYLDEMCEKQKHITATWHFIGRLQSRKIESVLCHASCLHAVSRIKELELIARNPIPFFVQFNVSEEGQKNGFELNQSKEVVEALDRLELRKYFKGLMAMPASLDLVGESRLRKQFATLRGLRDQHFSGTLLNMGTSADFSLAIDEGSDVVRVGSSLFGERQDA